MLALTVIIPFGTPLNNINTAIAIMHKEVSKRIVTALVALIGRRRTDASVRTSAASLAAVDELIELFGKHLLEGWTTNW